MIPAQVEDNLHYIELITRKKISNVLVGNYTSILKGHGYDFVDHKLYQAGDDIRKIDWNATARTSHPLVRNTHEERDLDVFIVADLSRSMELVTASYSKKELLLYVTAALAYSALSDDMRVGFIGFTDRVEMTVKPGKGRTHLWSMMQRLWACESEHAGTRVKVVMDALGRELSKMSLVFLVSDYLFDEDIFQELSFKKLTARHDFVPVILRDPWEAELPEGRGYVWMRDLETGRESCVRLSSENRARFAESVERRHRLLVDRFYEHGLDFVEIPTNQEFHQLLLSLFLLRKRR